MPDYFWQKDFYDHVIKKEESIAKQVRYILNNPVRKGLVDLWDKYPYSGSIGINLEDILQGCLE